MARIDVGIETVNALSDEDVKEKLNLIVQEINRQMEAFEKWRIDQNELNALFYLHIATLYAQIDALTP